MCTTRVAPTCLDWTLHLRTFVHHCHLIIAVFPACYISHTNASFPLHMCTRVAFVLCPNSSPCPTRKVQHSDTPITGAQRDPTSLFVIVKRSPPAPLPMLHPPRPRAPPESGSRRSETPIVEAAIRSLFRCSHSKVISCNLSYGDSISHFMVGIASRIRMRLYGCYRYSADVRDSFSCSSCLFHPARSPV